MRRLILTLCLLLNPLAHSEGASSNTMNLRFSPLGLVVGAIGIQLDFKIHSEWTLGPALSYWHVKLDSDPALFTSQYDVTASTFGARANWFKNGVYTDGLYVGPALEYASVKVKTNDSISTVSATGTALMLSGLVGYGWFWESFNMMLGGGLGVALGGADVEVTDSSGSKTKVKSPASGLALEYSLGWTF